MLYNFYLPNHDQRDFRFCDKSALGTGIAWGISPADFPRGAIDFAATAAPIIAIAGNVEDFSLDSFTTERFSLVALLDLWLLREIGATVADEAFSMATGP